MQEKECFIVVNDGSETGIAIANLLVQRNNHVILIERQTLETNISSNSKELLEVWAFDFYDTNLIEPEVKKLSASKGVISGFIYAAGIGGVRPLGLTTTTFLHQMMNANLYAFIEFARCVCKKQRFKDGGSVVALSSVSSTKGLKSKIAYSASKAALDASIRGLAAELADRKIRVNSIQKGWVRADMKHSFIQDNMALSEADDLAKQPLGVIESEELASMVAYLLSPESRSITGTHLVLDGGYTL